jgi:hypothetical protein
MNAHNLIVKEESKMEKIIKFIEKIKLNKVTTRN